MSPGFSIPALLSSDGELPHPLYVFVCVWSWFLWTFFCFIGLCSWKWLNNIQHFFPHCPVSWPAWSDEPHGHRVEHACSNTQHATLSSFSAYTSAMPLATGFSSCILAWKTCGWSMWTVFCRVPVAQVCTKHPRGDTAAYMAGLILGVNSLERPGPLKLVHHLLDTVSTLWLIILTSGIPSTISSTCAKAQTQ